MTAFGALICDTQCPTLGVSSRTAFEACVSAKECRDVVVNGQAALMFVYKSVRHANILPSILMEQNNVKLMCKVGDRAFDDG